MAGGVEALVMFWKEWGIQALVLLSFTLQVILLVSAEIRRCTDSAVLRAIVWSAYLLADTMAIYALGHMSVTSSRWLPEHQLMAFWAPFLLFHLGGQDNITAYSVEDNRLWLRHLQTLAVQVLAAGYVLYESSIIARQTLLRSAAILMFVGGVIKYGERVWALNCASSSNLLGKNYQSFGTVYIEKPGVWRESVGREELELASHQLLSFPKNLLKGPLPLVSLEIGMRHTSWELMYEVAEVQLSLMHDVFYSKAPVIYTWYGLFIRFISPMAAITTFVLFHRFSEKNGVDYRRVDVGVSYVLLGGAVVLEITSSLRAMFSSWAEAAVDTLDTIIVSHDDPPLVPTLICICLEFLVCFPRRLILNAMLKAGLPVWYWSGSMGQHNLIHLCTQSRNSRRSKIARWVGREDWWNTLVYTSSTPVPAGFSRLLKEQLLRSVGISQESPDHIINSRGRAALKKKGVSQEELTCWSMDVQLDESILVWHIATHVYLSWYGTKYSPRPALATTIEALSNYMMFLLAARPYMLPDNASRQRYVELCNRVINHLEYSSTEDLVRIILKHGEALNNNAPLPPETAETSIKNSTFDRASRLGAKLVSKADDVLDLISQVWLEMLCYASYQCRADSHARRLSNGGEIATVVAILIEYMRLDFFKDSGLEGFGHP